MEKAYHGCWPTMITPFTMDNRIDYAAVTALCEWYVRRGAAGIFAVCQSSEMFFLSEQEKLDLATAVTDAVAGRIKVIASGHTADEPEAQIDQLGRMAETGVDAVVLIANRLAGADEHDDALKAHAEQIFSQLPAVTFGLYECPYPYLRLLSTSFLKEAAHDGKLVFLKDVSCSQTVQEERATAVEGTPLALFNANTSTLLSSWQKGYDGYNGVMGNFHIDLYRWLYDNYRTSPELAQEVSDFLTMAAVTEARAYPVNAKLHCNLTGIPMTTMTRSKDPSLLNENGRHEISSLIRLENEMRRKLGLAV